MIHHVLFSFIQEFATTAEFVSVVTYLKNTLGFGGAAWLGGEDDGLYWQWIQTGVQVNIDDVCFSVCTAFGGRYLFLDTETLSTATTNGGIESSFPSLAYDALCKIF